MPKKYNTINDKKLFLEKILKILCINYFENLHYNIGDCDLFDLLILHKEFNISLKNSCKNLQELINLFDKNKYNYNNLVETTELWYKLSRKLITDNGGCTIINKKGANLMSILQEIYPKIVLYPWLFSKTPSGMWDDNGDKSLMIKYVSWFLKKHKISSFEDCYKIKNEDIEKNSGSGLLHFHEFSVYVLLKNTIIHKWLPWKFTCAPNGLWKNKKNIVWYIEWLCDLYNFTTKEDKYKIKRQILMDNDGSTLLSRFHSVYNILVFVYPDEKWDFWKVEQAPKYYWDKIEYQRAFMDSFHNSVEIKTQEQMYYVQIDEINDYGGSTLTCNIYGNRYNLYSSIFPELYWEKEQFFKKTDLCGNIECIHNCFNRSFASHPYSNRLSKKNKKEANKIYRYSDEKQLFECDICNHEFYLTPHEVQGGSYCPYCRKVAPFLCGDINCNLCYNNSLASTPLSITIIDKSINLFTINKNAKQHFECKCENCKNTFKKYAYQLSSGSFCSFCKKKTEQKTFEFLKILYIPECKILEIIREYRKDWCKGEFNNKLPYDFCIVLEYNNKQFNIIIEVDGEQHFRDVKKWCNYEMQHIRDIYKIKCALENNSHVIRIYQPDIWYDSIDWKTEIQTKINEILHNEIASIYFISNSNIYKDFYTS